MTSAPSSDPASGPCGAPLPARPRPLNPWLLSLALLGYGVAFGGAMLFGMREAFTHAEGGVAGAAAAASLGAMWLFGFAVIVLYALIGERRFRFFDRGIHAFTWRGWQWFAFDEVQRAELSVFKGNVSLVLRFGRWRFLEIPIISFEASASLLREIEKRLRVPVLGSASLRQRLD